MPNPAICAVLWDFGGVMTESPFLAFRRFEEERGLPADFLRGINARNHDYNAWARFERSELSPHEFDEVFAAETQAAGHEVRGLDVIDLLYGEVRPAMVAALRACKRHFTNACVTNNVAAGPGRGFERDPGRAVEWKGILDLFDVVIESSKIGVRKPEIRFFERACEQLGISASQAVYLDDLGTNLKPARTMGMRTIKVEDPAIAIAELESVLEISLH
ncbi:MAG: HAD-IA family hydrolase [Betaproteobacteria bacterium]|nr:HAD-IA family hydrolase [Betaproteobacteria bacterium]